MGCSTSKLDDEEVVRLCKDRKNFIKQAVEHRTNFSSGHVAYIQAMKRVSIALREYIDGDDPREFSLDSLSRSAFNTPHKKANPGFISISPIAFSVKPVKPETNSSYKINYYKSGSNNPYVSVEERPPQSPETYRVDAYSPMHHQFGIDSVFRMQSPPSSSMHASFFQYSPNNNRRSSYPPPSPQTPQWDFFWNPFSSLDYYGYPARESFGQTTTVLHDDDEESDELQQVRKEEGIPDLEEETEYEDIDDGMSEKEVKTRHETKFDRDEVIVEDVDDSDEDGDDDDDDDEEDGGTEYETDEQHETETEHVQVTQPQENRSSEITKAQSLGQLSKKETAVPVKDPKSETPGFTVYVNKRPTSMAEIIKDLEDQFTTACNAASEVSSILEATRAQYSSSSNDLAALKMLNPIALFRSGSSRSSSTRFLVNARDESSGERSSDYSEESSVYSGSHQSTLDRLYIWEKKLYQEVRTGERIRMAYEKKISQLRNQDVKGEDPSFVDKTRAAIRNLDTQIKVSIHTVEAISRRIETLRDEELEPQLIDLVQGLSRMWGVMAECHQIQKRTLDEAKILLAGTPSKLSRTKKYTIMSPSEPHRLARAASNLEAELRNWRSCFDSWIASQRSYIRAITSWLLRCINSNPNSLKSPFSPRRSLGAPTIFNICIKWSRFLDSMRESPVLEGLDFFAAGVGSLYNAQQLREDHYRRLSLNGSKRFGRESTEMVEAGHEFDDDDDGDGVVMTAEKMAEVAIRVLCAGMSVAVSSLTEFAVGSAEGYQDLIKQWENVRSLS